MSLRLVGGAADADLSGWKDGTAPTLRRFLDCQGQWLTIRELSDHIGLGSDDARRHVRRLVTSGLLQSRRRAERSSSGKRLFEYALAEGKASLACELVERSSDLSAPTCLQSLPRPDPNGEAIKRAVGAAGSALERQAYRITFSSVVSQRRLARCDTHSLHCRSLLGFGAQSLSSFEDAAELPSWEQLRTLCAELGTEAHALLLEVLHVYMARFCRDMPTTPSDALTRAQWGAPT